MIPIQEIPPSICQNLQGIFCDIDDTLTEKGKLPDVAYQALWKGHRAGLKIVPVTGRPAGWCDHIARMWPVDGVVGENGAFYFWMGETKMMRYYVESSENRKASRLKLEEIQKKILQEIPGAKVSQDQAYRESDLAIDFCEDVAPLERSQVLRIAEIFHEQGAKAKISSIHVNGWFGDFDKMTTCQLLIKNFWQKELAKEGDSFIYCGDSPNDEPMFKGFSQSVGVANIVPWLSLIHHPPKYKTNACCGEGFAEMVDVILKKRKKHE
ncbi:MAG: HAD-IIB family hydrolase [Candidatus Brocadiae bacterium]|nr:HAD-IIB family hydrolase [Candidatus Brocadiia bacterium]